MVLVRAAKEQDASASAHVHVQCWLTAYAGIVPPASRRRCLSTAYAAI